ncbi:uncharacterized protein A1O9_07316 [Exophiala aquamarina CBS 119918]|uniref:Transcription initiation factor TFIID subunit 4 n=1 Tax=Exophiala aquamarina CBS 119918 TaxID=1182545 RepID=A0A072PB71_9EURO|nr:uncharacterized protein A1O9_07316 [Exophiala aquamarina CBS 119918]KEF57126.1 hypothetical protein A1O9_07316 [Exophiala aquamarina CBS 119918]
MSLGYSSPSPQQFSPQFSQPPAKRLRLSPEAQSPFPTQNQVGTPTGQPSTPSGGASVNGAAPPVPRPGLMAPPQRPPDKTADNNYEDILSGTGINIEEEARMLVRPDYYNNPTPQTPLQSRPGGLDSRQNSFTEASPGGDVLGGSQQLGDGPPQTQGYQPTAEEVQQREEGRQDWEAARHSQHPLWDMFLQGGALNERIRNISISEHLVDPQSGVLVNTQKVGPPPTVRVNGLEGASRVIDKGQAILDTGQKGERLSEIMKVISLAAKARLSGLVSASSRMSLERLEHSKGRIPEDWKDIAVAARPMIDLPESALSPTGSTGLKRTFSQSQANSEPSGPGDQIPSVPRVTDALEKSSTSERKAEDARRLRRLKRRTATNADGTAGSSVEAAEEAALAAALESEKKTTKKERKLAESKFSEQQQHKSANEAARMAVSGLLGRGKKQRTYDWMNASKGAGASPAATPGRPLVSGASSAVGTPAPERARPAVKEKQFGQWDEGKESKIQARDVFLVLESDGRASRSYLRGLSLPEN